MEGSSRLRENGNHTEILIRHWVNNALLPSPSGRKCSIFRVQEKFHKINDGAYSPIVASIGPLHHGKQSLKAMEQTKLIFVNNVIRRKTVDEEHWLHLLGVCREFVEGKEEDARNCYPEDINLSREEFVQMMVIDGLFIIELFLRSYDQVVGTHGIYDPLLHRIGDFLSLTRDLLLLENQIPMFVLTGLLVALGIRKAEDAEAYMKRLSLLFFQYVMPGDIDDLDKYSGSCGGKHLLDFVANTCTFYLLPKKEAVLIVHNFRVRTLNATTMKRSGIKFKRGSRHDSFLNIKFNSKNGVLEIPPLDIHEVTVPLFTNLIASEQCSNGEITYFTAYVFFMCSLIHSAEDVRILSSNGIIQNRLGSDEDVWNIFNKLRCDVMIGHDNYARMRRELLMYCDNEVRIWTTTLKLDYFKNPFTIISILAATILLLLTLTQTIFTIIPVATGNDHQTRPPGS